MTMDDGSGMVNMGYGNTMESGGGGMGMGQMQGQYM
jgi:hypothetical protein